MAKFEFDISRNQFRQGNIDWVNDTIHLILVDDAWTPDETITTMEVANVPAANRVGDSIELTGKAVASDGKLTADNVIVTTVPDGETINGCLIHKFNTGVSSSDIPLFWMDEGTGFDLDTDGNNVSIAWGAGGVNS